MFILSTAGVPVHVGVLLVHKRVLSDSAMRIKRFVSIEITDIGGQLLSTIFSPFSAFSVVLYLFLFSKFIFLFAFHLRFLTRLCKVMSMKMEC